MSRHHAVHSALRAHLLEWPDRPTAIAWQGLVLPQGGVSAQVSWARERYSPGPTTPETIGPTPTLRTEGVYLLELFVPTAQGTGVLEEWGDSLISHYAPRLTLRYDGVETQLLAASRLPMPQLEPGWLQLPFSIRWRSDTTNPR